MGSDQWNWEKESYQDIQLAEIEAPPTIHDPLLELAAELVLCYDAVAESRGTFCTACTCQLGYHLTCDDGECETCGCIDIYKLCTTCGTDRPLEVFAVGSTECNYCINFSPIKIKPDNRRVIMGKTSNLDGRALVYIQEREKEARRVLKELSD